MALAPGDKLGPYEIVEPIGKGGMGAVYRARDTRLGRDVAVKVSDQKFGERFEREARVISSLNHPNICTLHDVGENFLVMELVEGETLAERIKQGAIPLEEALAIARQIADALEAAHEMGVVHRDLKPGNVIVKEDGSVKVLDFGLAKAGPRTASASPDNPELSPTISMAATEAGVILGTAAYMAPEQARGKNVDKRADIWAFGVSLYEMVTGRRLFQGEDLTDTLASVVKIDPDLSQAPPELRRLLEKCLAKDPKKRLRDIGDVWELLGGPHSESASKPAGPSKRSRLWPAVAAVAAVVAFALGAIWPRPEPLPEVTRFEITAPKGSTLRLGTPAPSPDGRMLAYTVVDPDGITRIHLRRLDQTDSRALPGTDGAIHPFWSPDGRSLAFVTSPGRELKRIDVEAGDPRVLAENIGGPWHGDWNANGDILAQMAGGTARVSAQGAAAPQPLDLGGGHPFFLPDGKRFLFRSGQERSIQLGALNSKDVTTVLEGVDSAPLLASTPRGKTYLLYLQGPDLAAREFDTAQGAVRGEPFVLVPNIGVVATPAVKPAVGVSRNGVLAYQQGTAALVDLTWFDRSGHSQGSLPADAAGRHPRLSPDGSMLSVVRDADVWVTDLERRSSTRVTFNAGALFAVWAPDGKRLAFGPHQGVRTINRDGSEEKSVTKESVVPLAWSRDGQQLLISPEPGAISLLSLDQTGKPVPMGSRNGLTHGARISPDGHFIAFESDESGRNEIYVQPMPPGTGQTKVSVNGGSDPRWNPNGRELFFVSPEGALMVADTQVGQSFSAGVPHELFRVPEGLIDYDVHPDGRRFLISRRAGGQNEYPITVVLNWWADLNQ